MKELQLIQTKLKAPKNNEAKGQYGKVLYRYRSCEDILEAVKPLLAEQQCTITIDDEIVIVGTRFYVKATATIENEDGDTISTTAFAREPESLATMNQSQVTGAASSYARKYALNGLLAIDDTKDADGIGETPAVDTDAQVEAAIKEMEQCLTREAMVQVWNKYKAVQGDKRMRDAAQRIGQKFKVS